MFKGFRDEIDGIMTRDPAARSALEVVLNYPSFHAMLFYRVASWLWRHKLRLLGRWISQWGRFWTGIEIHPGAKIGRGFFIDHGMGVVIGETAEIGDNVTLYHGVTLGGTAPSVDSDKQRNTKRHPTLEDGVIIGAGAQILGPITVGRNARVGANAVAVREVPPNVTVTGIPAKMVVPKDRAASEHFMAYGTPEDMPDPVVPAIETLRTQLVEMMGRVQELEDELSTRDKSHGNSGPLVEDAPRKSA
jgi:serine O-acetyltransferase